MYGNPCVSAAEMPGLRMPAGSRLQPPAASLQFLPLTEPGWAMRLFSTGLETRCNAQKPQEQFKQTHLATITINILKLHRDMSV